MRPTTRVVTFLIAAFLAVGVHAEGQEAGTVDRPREAGQQEQRLRLPSGVIPQEVPLKVRVVVARLLQERRVSSAPYELSVAANGNPSNLRMVVQVPVAGGTGPNPPINYRDVGTLIDCRVFALADGRFSVFLTIDDSGVYAEESRGQDTTPRANMPSFRTFRATSTLLLRDGESSQFTIATDKVTGEVIRADVTLTVVK